MENTNGQNKPKNTKDYCERKPYSKLKRAPPPPVRQTLTSYKRMLKANPLLKYEEAGINIDEFLKSGSSIKMGTTSEITDSKASCNLEGSSAALKEFKKPERKPALVQRTQSLKVTKSNGLDMGGERMTIISRNQPLTNNYFRKPPVNPSGICRNTAKPLAKPKIEVTSKYMAGIKDQKKLLEIKPKVNSFLKTSHLAVPKAGASTTNMALKPGSKGSSQQKVVPLRRSLSSGHLQSKKGQIFDPKQAYSKSIQSQSEENISVHLTPNAPLGFSPIMEENSGSRNLVFKTPSAYERRSICHFTPRSLRKSSVFQASTPAPVELQRLQERLNKWLKSRGKPLASFHHLRCFGVEQVKKSPMPTQTDEENKENIEVINETSDSYENLQIATTPEITKPDLPVKIDIPEEELAKVAKDAMVELQKLIEEDYPRAQCLGWLELIREKYGRAVDEPEYWECRAAIEQSLGNVGNALEFYKTAIIQGAEVTTVDKSLDQLLKKFSLLNISPSRAEQNKSDGNKERIVREARTVFKSTIIQFAVQERKLKKKTNNEVSALPHSTKLVATPVRRSTRMSRSCYVSTPGVKLCTSLREINLSSEEIDFEKNKALC